MSASSLASNTAEAFNRHGKFTARVTEHGLAVEIRHVDTGSIAAELWTPDLEHGDGQWWWDLPYPAARLESAPGSAGVDEIVAAVAESLGAAS